VWNISTNWVATKKDLIDTKTKLEGVKIDLMNTNTKIDSVITEMVNTKPEISAKMDGEKNYNTKLHKCFNVESYQTINQYDFTATKKDLIDTKTRLEAIKMELTNTNTKIDGVKTELMNTKTDLATKLDGEPYLNIRLISKIGLELNKKL